MINKTLEYIKKHIFILYIILFIIMLIKHFNIQLGIGDDPWFLEQSKQGLLAYTQGRINVWTSRNIIEACMLILLNMNANVWIILDSLMFLLIYYSIRKIVGIKNSSNDSILSILLLIVIVLFPFNMFGSAGWYATTLNYIWPLALGLYTLSFVKDMVNSIKPKPYEYLLVILSSLYATNQEQMCALIFGFSVLALGYCIYSKRSLSPLVILIFIISLGMLAYHGLCPGNAARKLVETAEYFPTYESFNLLDKLTLGILSTVSVGLVDPVYVVYIIVPVLLYVNYINHGSKKYNYILIIMTLIDLTISVCDKLKSLPVLENIYNLFYPYMYSLEKINYMDIKIFIIILLFVVNLIVVLYPIIKYLNITTKLESLIILFAGLCSRIILGFSASVFVSGNRTFLFFDILIIITAFIVGKYSLDNYPKVVE